MGRLFAFAQEPAHAQGWSGFADPDYDLATDWLEAKDAIRTAQQLHDDRPGPIRILLINGSSRSTNHEALDADEALQREVRDVELTLLTALQAQRAGGWAVADAAIKPPRDT
jgi:hypothetical protein